ncbi:MAG: hypothetical protein V1749_01320 [Candidatus Desantisbacteria bacterium]
MQTLQMIQEVAKDGYLHVRVPEEMGRKVELTIVRLEDNSTYCMKLQEQSGFVNSILASTNEDVWNEL